LSALKALRDATARSIQENPIEIAIHRVEYVDDGAGGRVSQENDLPAFVGRLAPSGQSHRHDQSQNEAGIIQTADWMLIAPWDADIRHGSNVEDTFTVEERKYRVMRVIPRKWKGNVYAIHALVEEVS